MHLICTVILDLCVILANSMFNWSNAELEQHQVFPGIYFQGVMPHLTQSLLTAANSKSTH